MSPRRMAKSGGARRALLVLVRNSTTAEQADLCVKVRTKFLLTTDSENVFLSRLHQSFADAALVRYDISCWCALNRVP